MSHKSTIRYIDEFGKDFDEPVIAWSKEVNDFVWKVSYAILSYYSYH